MKRSSRKPTSSDSRAPIQARHLNMFRHSIRFGTSRGEALYRLKATAHSSDLFALYPHIVVSKDYLDDIHGNAFPTSYGDLFSRPAHYAPTAAINEVMWGLCRCLQFGRELNQFNKLRESFEESFIQNDQSKCLMTLTKIEENFGASIWLLQSELATSQFWSGIESTRNKVKSIESKISDNPIFKVLLSFISKRVEATGVKDFLKKELTQLLAGISDKPLEKYFHTKLFELWDINTQDVPTALFFEGHSSIIDVYEMLISVLQAAASDKTIFGEAARSLTKAITSLYKATGDRRLPNIMRGIEIEPPTTEDIDKSRAAAIEAYTVGDYEACNRLAQEHLDSQPADLALLILQIKACVYGKIQIPEREGVWSELPRSFADIFSASEELYAAAYRLFALAERFYGQSWVNYLHAALAYELREEQADFPPTWLRDIYVRDTYLSPFTAVAASGPARNSLLNTQDLHKLFPYTTAVYRAVDGGEIPDKDARNPRYRRYLGRHFLARGDAATAVQYLENEASPITGSDQIRARGMIALAHMQLGNSRMALDVLSSAYFENEHAPSFLPLTKMATDIGEPAAWPSHIAVPILFELYSAHVMRDKSAKLAYAFECFQTTNDITEPSTLLKFIERFGKKSVVYYLDKIWRPEIMRQTILYEGTRQIEDTRMKVCRLLAEIDPDKAADYLDEIKDTVKRQQISQSISLVEQSKVYVDIESIRNSLRTKLGDSYTRYKSTTKPKQDTFIYEIAKTLEKLPGHSLPKLLSDFHVLDAEDSLTESDVQFAALFAEVTNEFLKGDHGLNAYLSTRVRHGKLSNTLRRAVEDEHLVTARREDGAGYVENSYWADRAGEETEEWKDASAALTKFAREFDEIIDFVKDKLIQIRVSHELRIDHGNSEALFFYQSTNLERRYVQHSDQKFKSIDELVNYYVNVLWEKTDQNLSRVQQVLSTDIKNRILSAFDSLAARLQTGRPSPMIGELGNAVARSRTATQNRLAQISAWFRRNEVYDRPDYFPDFPAQVALNMIKKTISSASAWEGVRIESTTGGALLPGRTLDSMVDIYYDLLENSIARSGLPCERLEVDVSISYQDSIYSATVSNRVAAEGCDDASKDRITRLKDTLGTSQSRTIAQSEGKSGLMKIWVLLNSPSYTSPSFDFSLADQKFQVEFSFNCAGEENEISTN